MFRIAVRSKQIKGEALEVGEVQHVHLPLLTRVRLAKRRDQPHDRRDVGRGRLQVDESILDGKQREAGFETLLKEPVPDVFVVSLGSIAGPEQGRIGVLSDSGRPHPGELEGGHLLADRFERRQQSRIVVLTGCGFARFRRSKNRPHYQTFDVLAEGLRVRMVSRIAALDGCNKSFAVLNLPAQLTCEILCERHNNALGRIGVGLDRSAKPSIRVRQGSDKRKQPEHERGHTAILPEPVTVDERREPTREFCSPAALGWGSVRRGMRALISLGHATE